MIDPAADWRPTAKPGVLATRAKMLAAARAFFAARGVMEVETPVIADAGVTDPNIESVRCSLAGSPRVPMYLRSSPEYCMKRLLAAGSPDIYEISRVFRDSELGSRHQPEFTMAEWYRRDLSLAGMVRETCDFIGALGAAAGVATENVSQWRYRELFLAATGLDPLLASAQDLRACADERLAGQLDTGLVTALGEDIAGWLDLLMSHLVIPGLPDPGLLVITHFPACQAALARLNPDEPDEAERFEVFRGGLELANGYRELRDADEQRRRFAADQRRRAAAGQPAMEPDRALLAALAAGLPDCCGVAVGFDRVVMSYLQLDELSQATAFARLAG